MPASRQVYPTKIWQIFMPKYTMPPGFKKDSKCGLLVKMTLVSAAKAACSQWVLSAAAAIAAKQLFVHVL